jgi:UDP-glucose 4-epimerase
MKIVVTGSSGFIGQVVVRELLTRGVDVLGVCRTPVDSDLPLVVISDYSHTPVGDVLIHLAEDSNLTSVQKKGANYQKQALNVLSGLVNKGFSHVIYGSSSLVYGTKDDYPRNPNESVFPENIYTQTKLACEKFILEVKGISVRMANIYGFGMASNTVISDILKQIPGNNPIQVRDDSPVRDFLWVEDAACGIVEMALSSGSGIYNLGSGAGVSIGDLLEKILHLAGQSYRQIQVLQPSKETSNLILDISLTTSTFGWLPKVEFEEGLRCLVNKCNLGN